MGGTANTKDRRFRGLARRSLAAVFVGVAGAAALAAAAACLPDLAAFPEQDASFPPEDATAVRFCGDEIITPAGAGRDGGESCDPGDDAAVPGCSGCRITCDESDASALDRRSGHCYFVAGSDSDYTAAQLRCRGARAHVVTMSSDDEAALVRALAPDDVGSWVGLALSRGSYFAESTEEPGFPAAGSGPCDGCFGVGADGGVFPSSDVPDGGSPECVASRNGSWFRVPCKDGPLRRTVCEREPAGARLLDECVSSGVCFSVSETADKKSYVLFPFETDPDMAAQSCKDLDGRLAVFETRAEREQTAHELLQRLINDRPLYEILIGLSRDEGGVWSWDDGVPVEAGRPLPWGNAQPGADAGRRAFMRLAIVTAASTQTQYDTQLAYADDGTNKPRFFLCQRPPAK